MSFFKTKPTLISALVSSLFLAGCGGSSSDGDDDNSPPPTTSSTGVFIDSAVSGISYRTATLSGQTNAGGEYQYAAGETVTFSIGGVNFPPVAAKAVVTPFDMSTTKDGQLNIGLLLQSLDADGDASNGISITSATLTAFKDLASPNFETGATSFKANFSSEQVSTWKPEDDVKVHLANANGYVGTWLLATSGADKQIFFKMTSDGQYFILSDQNNLDGIADVVQKGTYVFDTATSEITLTKTVGDVFDPEIGPQSGLAYELRFANDLSSFELVFNENDTPKFNRIVDIADEVKAPDALYGIWEFDDEFTNMADKFISFNKDNSYIEFSMDGNSDSSAVLYEKGIYGIDELDDIEGKIITIVSVTETTDKTKGISNEIMPRFSVAGEVMTLTVGDTKEEIFTLTKMLPF